MKHLSVISSLVYAILMAVYFIFGKDDSPVWSCYYFANTGLYISLLLLDKVLACKNIKIASMLISAIVFQVLFVLFDIYLIVFCSENYYDLVSSVFWSTIAFVVFIAYILTYKILDIWVNG